jgi:hypothetical protein
MSDTFDAYYTWLGIPPAEQPANHYRLLGLQLFEASRDVIDNAADRQMVHVRTYQTGKHAALSQKILNEISAARLCLLDDHRRAAYDEQLRARLKHSPAQRAVEPWMSARPAPASSLHSGEVTLAGPLSASTRIDERPVAASTPLPHTSPSNWSPSANDAYSAAAAYLPQPAGATMVAVQPTPPSPRPPTLQLSSSPPPVSPPTAFHQTSGMSSAAAVAAATPQTASEPIASLPSPVSSRRHRRHRNSDIMLLLAIAGAVVMLAVPVVLYLLASNSGVDKTGTANVVIVDPSLRLNPRTSPANAAKSPSQNSASAPNNFGLPDSIGSTPVPSSNTFAVPPRNRARMADKLSRRRERTSNDVDGARKILQRAPNDPSANLTYGKHVCLVDGDWQQGLPMLAKCDDDELKAAAAADLAAPTEPDPQIAVADAWFDLADSDESLAAFHARAHYWYEQALPNVTDVTKTKVEERLAEIANVAAAQALIAKGKLGTPTDGKADPQL